VAQVWLRLANSHKSEQHVVLTQELQKVCRARGMSAELYAPVITTTLQQMVVGFQFAGHGVDDLTSSGCQPFFVSYAGSAHHYLAVAAVDVGNQLSQGEQNASLSNYRTIRDKEKLKFPRGLTEVCITLTRFAVLSRCMFQGDGALHPFVEAMWATVAGFQNGASFITERFHLLSRCPGVAVLNNSQIIWALQLRVHDYMQMVASNVAKGIKGVEMPNFTTMLQEMRRGTFHNSTNWVEIPSLPSSRCAPMVHATMREHRPPTNDAGNELCMAWWTKGGYFPNCGRGATHVPFASKNFSARGSSRTSAHISRHKKHPTPDGAALRAHPGCSMPPLERGGRGSIVCN
jgi:hypothetical protein